MGSRNRRRIPIPFGGGLDRETGVMSSPPTGMSDLRNVFLHRGKYLVRRGFQVRVQLNDGTNDMTDVIGGHALKSLRNSIYVGYDDTTGNVQVFRGDSFGSAATFIGNWFSVTAGSPPPTISMAESYGRVFLAHDEALVGNRAKTIYYDSGTDSLVDLQSDLAGSGDEDVYFRGVARHLNYLVGWGYGNSADPSRPEMVRISLPADPTEFNAEHYFITGDRNDPVIRCIPAGGTLLAFKESETWEIFGYSRDSFGQRILDPLYGVGVARLAVNVSGRVFAWTNEGPRLYDGSFGSTSLEIPLELPQPEPDDLVAESDLQFGFAEYLPYYRVVLFFFGKRVYALTTREDGDWKWSYWELGFEPLCGFRLPITVGGISPAPSGNATGVSISNETDTTVDISWTDSGATGTESLEVWARLATGPGAWSQVATFSVDLSGSGSGTITGLAPGRDYEFATRYRRGLSYNPLDSSSDPTNWQAAGKTTGTTTLSAPSAPTGVWSRVSASVEQVLLTVTPLHSGVDIEILDSGLSVIHTEAAPTGEFTFAATTITGEANNTFYCRHKTVDVTGTNSPSLIIWGGPANPPTNISLTSVLANSYGVTFTPGDASLETEVYDDWTRPGGPKGSLFETLAETLSPADTGTTVIVAAGGNTLEVTIRHKQTAFGVDDFSSYDNDTILIAT